MTTMPSQEDLESFAAMFGATSARLVSLPSGKVTAVGDVLAGLSLVRTLVGSPAAARRLDASLEGLLLPQSWAQGDVVCLVWKPQPESLLVCVFVCVEGGAVGAYRLGKEMDPAVVKLFASKPPSTPPHPAQ